MQTRNLQLERIFSALGGDSEGYIRRGNGKLRVNIGDPLINRAISRILLKHFNSSTQNLSFEVFKRLCVEAFKVPLQDGFSVWHRLIKIQQGIELADFRDSCGIDISVEPSFIEEAPTLQHTFDTSVRSSAQKKKMSKSERSPKTQGEKNVFKRLSERNLEKEQVLEAIRRRKSQEEIDECFFYPQVKGRRPGSPPRRVRHDLYERMLKKEEQKESQLETARRAKAVASMKECTFQPNVASASRTTSPQSSRHSSFALQRDHSEIPLTPANKTCDSQPSNPSASPLPLQSPAAVRFSFRELQAHQEQDSSAPETQRFIIGGGRRRAITGATAAAPST